MCLDEMLKISFRQTIYLSLNAIFTRDKREIQVKRLCIRLSTKKSKQVEIFWCVYTLFCVSKVRKNTCCLIVSLHIYFMKFNGIIICLINTIFNSGTVVHQTERTDSRIYLIWNLVWSKEKEVKVDRVVYQIDRFSHQTSVFKHLVAADGWVLKMPYCD